MSDSQTYVGLSPAQARRQLAELESEVRRLVEDDPVNGYGGFVTREECEGGDYSRWPAVARALRRQESLHAG